MKIITLHQPWASLVALGLKRYETRHWRTDYRGPLLIHAAKRKMGFEERKLYLDAVEHGRQMGLDLPPEKIPFAEQLPLGFVVAIADLSFYWKMRLKSQSNPAYLDAIRFENALIEEQSDLERMVGLWEPGRYALQLDNVRALPNPIPFTSRQGKLLNVPLAIESAVSNQLKGICNA